MGEGRMIEPGRLFGRRMSLLLLAGTVALSGCEGDTLYDAVPADVDPPVVTVVSPAEWGRGSGRPAGSHSGDGHGRGRVCLPSPSGLPGR